MIRDYPILLDDDTDGVAHIQLTDEGVIVDFFDAHGEIVASWAATAQEILEDTP